MLTRFPEIGFDLRKLIDQTLEVVFIRNLAAMAGAPLDAADETHRFQVGEVSLNLAVTPISGHHKGRRCGSCLLAYLHEGQTLNAKI